MDFKCASPLVLLSVLLLSCEALRLFESLDGETGGVMVPGTGTGTGTGKGRATGGGGLAELRSKLAELRIRISMIS